jgi:spore maturation protein CgeB
MLCPHLVDFDRLALEEVLGDVDLVLVHEWNPPALIERIGRHRARGGRYTLLFHDTHHRSLTDAEAMSRINLDAYDGVLAFGDVIRERYVSLGWNRRAWTWHEAADARTFAPPLTPISPERDLIWIGNWGDDERSAELRSHLIEPVRDLELRATVHGVRYPDEALRELEAAGISFGGWIANYDAPAAYARHRMTVHIPRRPYVEALPGIPTIRVFEALACGIPLVSMPWADVEELFTPGFDFLIASDAGDMREKLKTLRDDADLRAAIAAHGIDTIRRRHTCGHRVDELFAILRQLGQDSRQEAVTS